MLRKKSLGLIVLIFVIGRIIPIHFQISNVDLINNGLWKLLIHLAFSTAALIASIFNCLKIFKNKRESKMGRNKIFIIIIIFLLINVPIIIKIYTFLTKVLMVILGIIFIIGISFLVSYIVKKNNLNKRNKKFNYGLVNNAVLVPYKKMTSDLINKRNKELLSKLENNKIDYNISKNKYYITSSNHTTKLKTITELWDEKDPNSECIKISNVNNKNLKWIKIYKGKYADGNFYGYIMMNNARKTVNGVIYYSDRPIWYNLQN